MGNKSFGPNITTWAPASIKIIEKIRAAAENGSPLELTAEETDRLAGILWILGVTNG